MNNEPVLVNGIVSVLAAVLTPIVAKYGYDQNTVIGVLAPLVTLVIAVVGLVRARSKVTPYPPQI